MSADNVVNKTRIANFIQYDVRQENRKEAKQARSICAKLVGSNECETSYKIFSCLYQAMKYSHMITKTLPNGHKIITLPGENECIEETGADPALIKSALDNGSVDDQNVKCYFACRAKRNQQMTEDDIVNKKRIKDLYFSFFPAAGTKGLLRQPISECIERTGEDICETAFLIAHCFVLLLKAFSITNNPSPAVTKRRYVDCAVNVDLELLASEAIDGVARDPEVKCYFACHYKKINYMSEDGTINKTEIINRELRPFEKNQVRTMAEKHLTECAELSGENECDTAHLIEKCLDSVVQNISNQLESDCRNENHVDSETLKTELSDENPGQNIKCYRACMFQKFAFMAENGTVFKEYLISMEILLLPQNKKRQAHRPLKECANLTGEDKCDTAYLIYKCMSTIIKKLQEEKNIQ